MFIFRLRIIILLVSLLSLGKLANAQTEVIDTIMVDMITDTAKKSVNTVRPALNLSELRKAAREDSIRIAKMADKKVRDEKEEIELLKQKRLKEKELKQQKQKELAEKRKQEKEEREKAYAAKKAKKEEAEKKVKAEKKKKKSEKRIAKALEVEKEKKKEAAEQEKLAQEKKEKESKVKATKEANKAEKEVAKAADKEAEKQSKQSREAAQEAAQKKASEKAISDIQKESTTKKNVTNKIAEPIKESSKSIAPANKPTIPVGVEQKDNVYGTVRIAYDEQAASFLLSIPTETKMHYHNDHSEQIMLIEGEGMVLMGYKTIKLKRNELIFITKGTPHKIINSGKRKLKVLSIQAPFYDGTDKIILE